MSGINNLKRSAWLTWSQCRHVTVNPSHTQLNSSHAPQHAKTQQCSQHANHITPSRSQTAVCRVHTHAQHSPNTRGTVIETINFKLNCFWRGWHFTSEYHRRLAKLKGSPDWLWLSQSVIRVFPKKLLTTNDFKKANLCDCTEKDWILTCAWRPYGYGSNALPIKWAVFPWAAGEVWALDRVALVADVHGKPPGRQQRVKGQCLHAILIAMIHSSLLFNHMCEPGGRCVPFLFTSLLNLKK